MTSASASASLAPSSSHSASLSVSDRSPLASAASAISSEPSSFADRRLATALLKCEEAWEAVYTATGELGLALVAVRTSRGFSRIAGHQILTAASKAQSRAGEGQGDIASVHRMLEQFLKANNIATPLAYGDGRDKPAYADYEG